MNHLMCCWCWRFIEGRENVQNNEWLCDWPCMSLLGSLFSVLMNSSNEIECDFLDEISEDFLNVWNLEIL